MTDEAMGHGEEEEIDFGGDAKRERLQKREERGSKTARRMSKKQLQFGKEAGATRPSVGKSIIVPP